MAHDENGAIVPGGGPGNGKSREQEEEEEQGEQKKRKREREQLEKNAKVKGEVSLLDSRKQRASKTKFRS